MMPRRWVVALIGAVIVTAAIVVIGIYFSSPVTAPEEAVRMPRGNRGGVLRIYQYDSPASMSIHEEAFNSAQNPMMAVFNNLVLFDQSVPQNRMDTILPELATKWSWNADLTELTFQLRPGVNWH